MNERDRVQVFAEQEKPQSHRGGVSQALSSENHDAAVAYGINPQGGGMNPFDEELGETQSVCHQGGVMQVRTESVAFLPTICAPAQSIGDEREVSPTLSHKPSALEPTAAQSQCDLSQMRYIVRRLTPTEAERLMGLPSGYTIPRGLRITDELVAEFQRIHDTYGAIMAEYEHKPAPKPKSANQVRAWLEKVTNPDTCPDSPRYRVCGNGWATNQPRWILTRLLALGEGIDPFTGEEL